MQFVEDIGFDRFCECLGDKYMRQKNSDLFNLVSGKAYDATCGRNILTYIQRDLPIHSSLRVSLLGIAAEGIPAYYLRSEYKLTKSVVNRATNPNPKCVVKRKSNESLLLVKHKPHERRGILPEEAKFTSQWFRRNFTKEKSGTENDRVYLSQSKFAVELAYYSYGHCQILCDMASDKKTAAKIEKMLQQGRPNRFLISYVNAEQRLQLMAAHNPMFLLTTTEPDNALCGFISAAKSLHVSSGPAKLHCCDAEKGICIFSLLPNIKAKQIRCSGLDGDIQCARTLHKSCAHASGTLIEMLLVDRVYCQHHTHQQDFQEAVDDMSEQVQNLDLSQNHWVALDEFDLPEEDVSALQEYRKFRQSLNRDALSIEKEAYEVTMSFLVDASIEVNRHRPGTLSADSSTGKDQDFSGDDHDEVISDDEEIQQIWEQIEQQKLDPQTSPVTCFSFVCQEHGCQATRNRKCSLEGGPYCRKHCVQKRKEKGGECARHREGIDLVAVVEDNFFASAPTFPRPRKSLWRMIDSNVHYVKSKHPHPCEVCDNWPILCDNLRRIERRLIELRPGSASDQKQTRLQYQRCVHERHNLRRKFGRTMLHFLKKKIARQYRSARLKALPQGHTQVTEDYGSRYNSRGQKANSLVMSCKYKEGGAVKTRHIINMCCNRKQNAEDWGFFRTVWDYHLRRASYQRQGFFQGFCGLELTGDNAGHFKNDKVMYYQSQWFELYGVTVTAYFLCDRHAYSEADGIWGVLNMLFSQGEAKGVRLSSVMDYAKYFFQIKKEHPGVLQNVEFYPFERMDRNPLYHAAILPSLHFGIKEKSEFIYTVLGENGQEVHITGVVRCRSLVGTGPFDVVDMRVGRGRQCKLCPTLLQRPVKYKRGPHHVCIVLVTCTCIYLSSNIY